MANPFTTPFPHLVPPATLSLDTTTAGLKRWTATLDLKDFGGATRRLYEQLRLINRTDIPPRARLDWLESLPGIVRIITEGLQIHYQNKPFPLSDTEMAVAQLANALHGEIILGYRHILASPPDTSLLGRNSERQMRQIACYRLFVHAGEILSNHRSMYTEPPTGIWRHLHAYYGRVRRQGWANVPIAGASPMATIEMEYRKVLLLALQPSQRVPPGEWLKIKQNIAEWLPLVPLLDAGSRPGDRSLYCIRFELDAPLAGATDRCCGACDSHMAGVLLDTTPLVEALEERLAFCKTEENAFGDERQPAIESIKTLLRSWRIPESPRELRVPVDVPLTIVSGLENIHAILSTPQLTSARRGTGSPHGETQQRIQFSAIPDGAFLEPFDLESEIVEISYSGWESALPSPWRVPPRTLRVEPLPARAVNASPAGYRLDMPLPEKNSMRLGESIALRGASADNWELFVLRWVRRVDSERATLGLERVGDGLQAIDIVVQSRDGARGVLHALTAFDEEMNPLVLMPPLPLLANKRLAIRMGEAETPITLVNNLTLSPIFEAFAYKTSNSEWNSRASSSGRSAVTMSSPDPFTAVWGVL